MKVASSSCLFELTPGLRVASLTSGKEALEYQNALKIRSLRKMRLDIKLATSVASYVSHRFFLQQAYAGVACR